MMFKVIVAFLYLINISLDGINADANLRLAFLPFSNLTNQFLYTIQPNDGLNVTQKYIYQALGSISFSTDANTYLNDIWQTYIGYFILVILGILFIIFFTLIGFCFCCCRCCCKKCGSKAPGASLQNTKSRRIVYNIILFLFSSMILIGAIVALASNTIFLDALKPSNSSTDQAGNVLANIDTTTGYAISYINYIANNGMTSGVKILIATVQKLQTLLSSVISIFINTFLTQLNFIVLMNATDAMITAYTQLTTQAQNLSTISSLHQNQTAPFAQFLQLMVQNLSSLMNSPACQNYSANCEQVNMSLAYLVMGFNDSNINYTVDINTETVVGSFNVSTLQSAKDFVLSSSQNITNSLNASISGYILNFTNSLNPNSSIYQSYVNIFNMKSILINGINSVKNTIYTYTLSNGLSIQNGAVYNYYQYVFYGFIVIIGIIILIILFFYVGLCFGICGGPNFEDSRGCSKGTGSGFFMGGVAVSFFVGWFIMLIVTIMFLVGGLLQTEVCRYVTYPPNPNLIQTLDQIANATINKYNFSYTLNNISITLPNVFYVKSLMINCPFSSDLISAFGIPSAYISSLSNIVYQQFISSSINPLVQSIQSFSVEYINLNPLINSTIQISSILTSINAINSIQTLTELNKPVTLIADVPGFLASIDNVAQLTNKSYPQFSNQLLSIINQLNVTISNLNSTHYVYATQKATFKSFVANMTSTLSTLSSSISSLPSHMNDAKTAAFIAANSTLVLGTLNLVNQTVFNVILSLGNCQGLATTFYSAINTVCSTLLIPFNNLWMGIGWFLLFIIPAIIVALKLHRIYRYTHIESHTSSHNKAYQNSNNFLSENDMAMIRMERPRKV